jgi:hypothetical protein
VTAPAPTTSSWPTEACRSCAAPVIWAVTEAGRPMPVDAEPAPDGTVRLEDRGGPQPLARVVPAAKRFGVTGLRKSHFATCPEAGAWRRRRAGAR